MSRNAQTKHSKMLRQKSSAEAYRAGMESGRIAQYSIKGDATMIAEQLAAIDSMPGKSRAEKIQELINKLK